MRHGTGGAFTLLLALLGLSACGDATEPSVELNPAPVLEAVAPAAVVVGGGGAEVVLTGSDFLPGMVATWNGTDRPTTVESATRASFTLLADDLAAAVVGEVKVANPGPGGGASAPRALLVGHEVPALDGVSPPSATAIEDAGVTLDVRGSGFTDLGTGSVVLIEESAVPTTYLGPGRLQAVLSDVWTRRGADLRVRVRNPAPGGGASPSVSFRVDNPTPVIAALSPDTIRRGEGASLTVDGSGFVLGATLYFDGVELVTEVQSPTRVTAPLPEGLAGSGPDFAASRVEVRNPGPGGGASTAVDVVIGERRPAVWRVLPPSVPEGAGSLTANLYGDWLAPDAAVTLGGQPVSAAFVDSTRLELQIDAALLQSAGDFDFVVENPRGGGASDAFDFPVLDPTQGVSWVIVLDYASHDVAWDPVNELAYFSVPDCWRYRPDPPCGSFWAGQFENRVWETDPNDGWLRREVFGGFPDPQLIALGDDGNYLFTIVPFWGVRRVDKRVPEENGAWRGIPQTDLEAVPGWAGAHVIAGGEGVRLRTDTTLASDVTEPVYELALSADAVFAYDDSEGGTGALLRASITPEGLVHDTTVFGALAATDVELEYGLGRLYAGDGTVLDATTLAPIGTIPAQGAIHVEAAENRVYFFEAGQVTVADATTRQVLSTFAVPWAVELKRIVRWGADGLGFGNGPAVVFIRSPLVPG